MQHFLGYKSPHMLMQVNGNERYAKDLQIYYGD